MRNLKKKWLQINKKRILGRYVSCLPFLKVMLEILISWILYLPVAYILGAAVFSLTQKVYGVRILRTDSRILAGLVIMTVYAQFFSLIGRVGLWANVWLFVLTLLSAIVLRKSIFADLRECRRERSIAEKCLLPLLVVLWAYMTSRGYAHYDTGLYHAQAIRWMEEVGIAPGLGLLHYRFSYNSSVFALFALTSGSYLGIPSLHMANGMFAIVLSMRCLDLLRAVPNKQKTHRRKLLVSDYAIIAAAYYMTLILEEVVSPASDYSAMMTVFFIAIAYLQAIEKKENTSIYCFICILGVYAMTLKLSSALVLILVIHPIVCLIRDREWKKMALSLGLGFLVALPWMIRSVYISGYLIYPVSGLDFFDVPWKLKPEDIAVDVAQISTWGRALYNSALVNMPITQWFGNWFSTTLSRTEQLLILADMGSVVIVVGVCIVSLIRRKREMYPLLLALVTFAVNFVYWLYSAPLMRYGYAHVLLLCCVLGGWICTHIRKDLMIRILVVLFLLYRLVAIGRYIGNSWFRESYLWQEDYEKFENEQYEVGGIPFYKAASGDRTGYLFFPSAPSEFTGKLRGTSLSEGFTR